MASASSLSRGDIVGKCEIIDLLGRGGMGAVYRCKHRTLQIEVALKIMSFSAATEEERNGLVQRFFREAHAAARIRHENVVSVLDVDSTSEGLHYMLMEIVDGSSVKKLVESGPLDPREAARLTRDTAKALSAAHALGIVHRDVKPENILLTKDRRVKISDFGIASVGQDTGSEEGPKLTQTGQVVGTPHYMSPEQVNGDAVDGRADIYSLGATLYHLLTGSFPFRGTSAFQVCMKHVMEALERPKTRHPGVPDALDELVVSMMAKKPGDRPQTAEAVADALDMWLRSAATVEMRTYAEMATGAPLFTRPLTPAPGVASSLVGTPPGGAAATPIRINTGAAQARNSTEGLLRAMDPEDSASMTLGGLGGLPGGPDPSAVAGDATIPPDRDGAHATAAMDFGGPSAPATATPAPSGGARADLLAATAPGAALGGATSTAAGTLTPTTPAPGRGGASARAGWPAAPETGGDGAAGTGSGKGENPALSAVMRVRGLAGAASSAARGKDGAEKAAPPASGAPVPPARPAVASKTAPQQGRSGTLVRALLMVLALGGAGFIGYKDGLHERTLKPLFLRMGWGWPPALLAKIGLGGEPQKGGGTVISGGPSTSTGGTVLAVTTIASEELERGRALAAAGKIEEALGAFQRVLDAPATDITRARSLGLALFRSAGILETLEGRGRDALDRYERLAALPADEVADVVREDAARAATKLRDRVPPRPTPLAAETFTGCKNEADRLFAGRLDDDDRTDFAVWGPEGGVLLLTKSAKAGEWELKFRLEVGEEGAQDADGRPLRLLGILEGTADAPPRPLRPIPDTLGDAVPASGAVPEEALGVDLYGDGAHDLVFSTRGQSALRVRRRDAKKGFLPTTSVELGGKLRDLSKGTLEETKEGVLAVVEEARGADGQARGHRIVLVSIDKVGLGVTPIAGKITAADPVAAIADLNGDGVAEVVASAPGDASGRTLAVWRRNASGAYVEEAERLDLGLVPARLTAAPIDEGGAPGLLAVAAGRPATLGVYGRRASGAGLRCAALFQLTGKNGAETPIALGTGDVDQDGRADALVLDRRRGILVLYGEAGGLGSFVATPHQ